MTGRRVRAGPKAAARCQAAGARQERGRCDAALFRHFANMHTHARALSHSGARSFGSVALQWGTSRVGTHVCECGHASERNLKGLAESEHESAIPSAKRGMFKFAPGPAPPPPRSGRMRRLDLAFKLLLRPVRSVCWYRAQPAAERGSWRCVAAPGPASELSFSYEKRPVLPNVAYSDVFAKSPPFFVFGGPF